jgi:hypothetical protein
MRHAIVTGAAGSIEGLLIGGRHATTRLAIHHRHYEASLVAALIGRFPATVWLVGAPFFTEAARRFVLDHPPTGPCIAEYGEAFPCFLATCKGADRVPYLRMFAALEWHLGYVAVAIDCPGVTIERFSQINVAALPDAILTMQPGLRYLQASWPVDDLMKLYLTDTAPDRLTLHPADVCVEIRGARGAFQINRVDAADCAFRQAAQSGRSIGEAAEAGLEKHTGFDPGQALTSLVADGLVTGIAVAAPGGPP